MRYYIKEVTVPEVGSVRSVRVGQAPEEQCPITLVWNILFDEYDSESGQFVGRMTGNVFGDSIVHHGKVVGNLNERWAEPTT